MRLVALAAVLLVRGARGFGATPDGQPRTPFAFDVSGGGFRTMSAGMAFSRALSQAFEEEGGGWDQVTHISGNSGGQWFATQFTFGYDFAHDLTHKRWLLGYKSLYEIFASWGRGYSRNVGAIPHEPIEPNDCFVGPINVADFARWLNRAFQHLGLPATVWETYTTAMMKTGVPDIDLLTYSSPRPGLPKAALLQMMALPPSVWTNSSFAVHYTDGFGNQGATNWPLYHRVAAATSALVESSPGFILPSLKDQDTALAFAAGFSPESSYGNEVFMKFLSLDQTRVAEVTAASSAAPALVASPTIIKSLVREYLPNITDAEVEGVLQCMPLGLQTLSPGFTLEVVGGPGGSLPVTGQPWTPTYRGFDGGYTDNSAIINAVSAMIADCEAGDTSLSCASKTFDIIAVDDGVAGPDTKGTACLFNHSGCAPVGGFFSQYFVKIPSTRIFSDPYPPEDKWIEYVTGRAGGIGASPSIFNFTQLPETIKEAAVAAQAGVLESAEPTAEPPPLAFNATETEFGALLGRSAGLYEQIYPGSRVTAGSFHTIENQAWAMKEGYTVNLLLFELNIPQLADPIIWPAPFAELVFLFLYGRIAEEQRKGALPYIKQWLQTRTISAV